MENIKAQIAFDLVPLMEHLYDGGILRVGPDKEVHMTVEAFHEVFPEVREPIPRESAEYPWKWTETVEGVEFFALAETPERP